MRACIASPPFQVPASALRVTQDGDECEVVVGEGGHPGILMGFLWFKDLGHHKIKVEVFGEAVPGSEFTTLCIPVCGNEHPTTTTTTTANVIRA
jgi:hypothetical protein